MKRSSIMLFLLLSGYQAFAQYAFRGQVRDEEQNPLAGAHVVLNNTFLGTSTDEHGNFVFKRLSAGEYSLTVSFVGYKSYMQTITVDRDLYLTIVLEHDQYMADEVVVKATRAGEKDPVPHTNLTAEEITGREMVRDIPYLLKLTPSLVSTSDAGTGVGYTSLRIRGSDATRINVTLNGIPLNDAESHGVFWVDLPDIASSLENVQIQRGVGTSTNGAGAFGATINLQTNTLRKEPYAALSAGGGSFRTMNAALKFGTGMIKDRFTFDGRVSRIYSDGFIDRAFSNLKSFSLSGGRYAERSILRVHLIHGWEETYQAWSGVPKEALDTNRTYNPYTYENEIDHYEQTHYQLHYSRELSRHLNLHTALHYTRGKGYYEQYQEEENPYHQTSFAHYRLPDVVVGSETITQTDLIRRLWLDNHFYGTTFSLDYKSGNSRFTLGGSWNRYIGDHYGRLIWARIAGESEIRHRWYLNTGDKRDFNIYAKGNIALTGKLNLYADFQYRQIFFAITGDENGLDDVGQEYTFRFLNPKTGLFYTISDRQEAYFSFAVGSREPTRDNFVDAQAAGNPAPVAEKLYDMEAGYQLRGEGITAGINAYYMYYRDQLVTTGEINYVGYPVMTNVPRSYRLGVEAEAGGRLGNRFSWSLNATLSRNLIIGFTEKIELYDEEWNFLGYREEKLGNTQLSFSPSFTGAAGWQYEWFSGFTSDWQTRYVGRQFIDNTSNPERSVDPYWVTDLNFAWERNFQGFGSLQVRFMIYNLFDHTYETHAWVYRASVQEVGEYTESGYFPQAGIHFMTGIRLNF
ncbi:MAG: TonB-dependent receptor [Bacteroidales bacterium]